MIDWTAPLYWLLMLGFFICLMFLRAAVLEGNKTARLEHDRELAEQAEADENTTE